MALKIYLCTKMECQNAYLIKYTNNGKINWHHYNTRKVQAV